MYTEEEIFAIVGHEDEPQPLCRYVDAFTINSHIHFSCGGLFYTIIVLQDEYDPIDLMVGRKFTSAHSCDHPVVRVCSYQDRDAYLNDQEPTQDFVGVLLHSNHPWRKSALQEGLPWEIHALAELNGNSEDVIRFLPPIELNTFE